MAYIMGPLSLPAVANQGSRERGDLLEGLSLRIAGSLPDDCIFIRWDLMAASWIDDRGRPLPRHLQEIRMNASTARRRLRKARSEHTCTDTMIVDLAGGESALWPRLDYRTRYSVRLAQRRGTLVRRAGEAGLSEFYSLYRETAQRQRLPEHSEELFRDLFRSAREHRLALDLYLAESEGKPAAAAIIARIGQEAWYLFAASCASLRAAAGPSAILYTALLDSYKAGANRMDLLGVGPLGAEHHPLSGLTLFKKGFGGTRVTRAGAWDYVLAPEAYESYAQMESLA